jgi:phage head maturation protease
MPVPNKFYVRELTIPKSVNDEKREVTCVIASESPVLMYDWDRGYVDEILLMSGVILPPDNIAPLVDTHEYRSTKSIKGSATNLRTEGNELTCEAAFSSTATEEWTKVKEGHIRKLSIGYHVHEFAIIPKGSTGLHDGKTYVATERDLKLSTKWELFEASLVTLPADDKTEFRNTQKGGLMPKENTGETTPQTTTQPAAQSPESRSKEVDVSELTRQTEENAAKRERTRINDIRSAGESLGLHNDFVQPFIDNGKSYEEAMRSMVSEHAKRAKPVDTTPSHVVPGTDDVDNYREAATLALCERSGVKLTDKEKTDVAKTGLRGVSLQGLISDIMMRSGERNVHLRSNAQRTEWIMQRAATTDFVNILANVQNKSLRIAYMEAPGTWRAWCKSDSLPDFKQATLAKVSAYSTLAIVAEGAAPTAGTLVDGSENTQLATYMRSYTLTRQAMINDDLRVFNGLGSALAKAAARTVNRAVYAKLLANGALNDTFALFQVANHANLTASGSAPSVASIGVGLVAMMAQSMNSVPLGITPAFIIVPPALAVTTEQLITSISDYASNSNNAKVNPFGANGKWKLEAITDANMGDTGLQDTMQTTGSLQLTQISILRSQYLRLKVMMHLLCVQKSRRQVKPLELQWMLCSTLLLALKTIAASTKTTVVPNIE